jgi:hypothetical protein
MFTAIISFGIHVGGDIKPCLCIVSMRIGVVLSSR